MEHAKTDHAKNGIPLYVIFIIFSRNFIRKFVQGFLDVLQEFLESFKHDLKKILEKNPSGISLERFFKLYGVVAYLSSGQISVRISITNLLRKNVEGLMKDFLRITF